MTYFKEQCLCTKSCFKLSRTAMETHNTLKLSFREEKISRNETLEWFLKLKSEMTFTEDAKCLQHCLLT